MLSSDIKPHLVCRVCGQRDLVVYCDLGVQPLANALVTDPTVPEFEAPLAVQHCNRCGLSQLTHTVSPEKLYKDYPFRAGRSKAWVEHTKALANRIMEMYPDGGTVLDIACNDATQLGQFRKERWRRIGVDPSPIPPPEVTIHRGYFSPGLAKSCVADVIIAQNVLGHVDDVHDFMEGIRIALAPNGVCVIEVPDLWQLFAKRSFDTIYHEHLSYWPSGPMRILAHDHGMYIQLWEDIPTHGGSRRYFLAHAVPSHGETTLGAPSQIRDAAQEFSVRVDRDIERAIERLGKMPGRMLGYGASAKGAVMLNTLKLRGNTVWPEAIIDDTPEKQGKYMPGVHIPIVPLRGLPDPTAGLSKVDYLWVLSWNLNDDLLKKAREAGFQGTAI